MSSTVVKYIFVVWTDCNYVNVRKVSFTILGKDRICFCYKKLVLVGFFLPLSILQIVIHKKLQHDIEQALKDATMKPLMK